MLLISIIVVVAILGLSQKISGWPLFVFSFILLNPMQALLPPNEAFLGFIDPAHIVALSLITTYYVDKRYYTTKLSGINIQRKRAIILMLVFIIGCEYVSVIKLFLMSFLSIGFLPKRIVRDVIICWAIILVIRRINDIRVSDAINKAILLGSIIIGISIYFSSPIQSIFRLGTGMVVSGRNSGFLALNPNGSGAYCAIIVGYCVAQIDAFKKKQVLITYLCIAFCFLGIIGTASRTAFLASLGIFIVFILKKKMSLKKILVPMLILIPISYIIYSRSTNVLSERLDEAMQGKSSMNNRYEVWQIYLNDLIEKPYYLLLGNTETSPTEYGQHNYYLAMIWSFGIFAFYYFIKLIIKILKYKNSLVYMRSFPVVYSIFAFLITSLTGADYPNYSLIIIIALSVGIPQETYAKFCKNVTRAS